jgi:putative nucleotidyltransferase with HDIG domain
MSFTIEEDLWFGGRSEDVARQNAAESLAALSARVHGVRPFPVAAQRLLDVSADEHATTHEVAQVVEADPALAARLLRLVNSSAFGLRIPCKSIAHAVSLLGLKKLGELAAASTVMGMFDDDANPAADAILEHGAAVAAVARHLAPSVSLSSEEMFLAGLLHDVGKLMMLQSEEDGYAELIEQEAGRWDAVHAHEQAAYGFDHAVLAGYVLREWRLPEPLPRVVAWHHAPTKAYEVGGRIGAMIHLLRLADRLAYELAANPQPRGEIVDEIGRGESATYLGITPNVLELAWPKLERLAREAGTVLRDPDSIPESTIGVLQAADDPSLSLSDRNLLTNAVSVTLSATRQDAIVLGCVVCGESSSGAHCPRCRGPICTKHVAAERPWCALCEGEYQSIAPPQGLSAPLVRASLLASTLGVIAIAVEPFVHRDLLDLVGVVALVAGIVAAAAHGAVGFATRAKFLAEKPGEARVPKG